MSHLKIPEFKYSEYEFGGAKWSKGDLTVIVADKDDYGEWILKKGDTVIASGPDSIEDVNICEEQAKQAILVHQANEAINNQLAIIQKLKAELKQKDEKLSEFQNGLPIEKAKTDGTPVLAWKAGSYFHATVQHCEDGVWGRLTDDLMFKASREQPDKFIALPSTETKEGE